MTQTNAERAIDEARPLVDAALSSLEAIEDADLTFAKLAIASGKAREALRGAFRALWESSRARAPREHFSAEGLAVYLGDGDVTHPKTLAEYVSTVIRAADMPSEPHRDLFVREALDVIRWHAEALETALEEAREEAAQLKG